MHVRMLSVVVLAVATASAVAAEENLALKAKVTATSEENSPGGQVIIVLEGYRTFSR